MVGYNQGLNFAGDDWDAGGWTGVGFDEERLAALDRLVSMDIDRRWDESDRADADHGTLALLARELGAELRAAPGLAYQDFLINRLEQLAETHEAPTPWSGPQDEAVIWGRALYALADRPGGDYDSDTMRELSDRLLSQVSRLALDFADPMPGLDDRLSFSAAVDRVLDYLEPRVFSMVGAERPSGHGGMATDVATLSTFARQLALLERRFENEVTEALLDRREDALVNAFRLWALAETDLEDCAAAVVRFQQAARDLHGYDPGEPDPARLDLFEARWLVDGGEDVGEKLLETWGETERISVLNLWLSSRGDERALSGAPELHLKGISDGLLRLDGLGFGTPEGAAEGAWVAQLMATLDLPDWADPDTEPGRELARIVEVGGRRTYDRVMAEFQAVWERKPAAG